MKNDSMELTLGDVVGWLEDQKEVHGRKMRQKVRRGDAAGASMALGGEDAIERAQDAIRERARMLDALRRSEAAKREKIRARNRKVARAREAKRRRRSTDKIRVAGGASGD